MTTVTSLSPRPWLDIWVHPRATVRGLLGRSPLYIELLLVGSDPSGCRPAVLGGRDACLRSLLVYGPRARHGPYAAGGARPGPAELSNFGRRRVVDRPSGRWGR